MSYVTGILLVTTLTAIRWHFEWGGKTVYGRQEMLQSEIRINLKQLLVLSCVSIFTSEALRISCFASPVCRFLVFEQRQKMLHPSSHMEARNAKYVGHFRTKWTSDG